MVTNMITFVMQLTELPFSRTSRRGRFSRNGARFVFAGAFRLPNENGWI